MGVKKETCITSRFFSLVDWYDDDITIAGNAEARGTVQK